MNDLPAQNTKPYDFDDDLLQETLTGGLPHHRVYPWQGEAVVLGRGSRAQTELNLETCRADGIPIYRRRGGGCSVYLDPGTAIATFTFPLPGLGRIGEAWTIGLEWLLRALEGLGFVGLEKRGISDLAIGDRKVAGTCLYRTSGAVLFSASLLVATDLSRIGRYLATPPREPDYRRGRTHGDFLACLAEPETDLAEFCRRLDEAAAPRS